MTETDPSGRSESNARASAEASTAGASSVVRKPRWGWGGVSTWTAVIGTILAVLGTVIAFEQAHLADVTNGASERQAAATAAAADQQSLVSLVSQIASLSKSGVSAPPDQVAQIHEEMAVDAEEGLALVTDLNGRVPAIDNFELGIGFEPSRELGLALLSFTRAGEDAADPFYRSKALRAAAAILYVLAGQSNMRAAHNDSSLAYHAFDGQPDVPRIEVDNNHELVDAWDARWAATSDCLRAATELQQAEQIVNADPASGDTAVTEDLASARMLVASCRAGRPIVPRYPEVPVS